MIRKLILFAFSPFVAVVLMVLPDALVVANRSDVLPEPVARIADEVSARKVSVEAQAWKGDAGATRTIGLRYARTPDDCGWKRSFSTWNRMLCVFVAPFASFMLLQIPILLLIFVVDRLRVAHNRPPVLIPRAMAVKNWLHDQMHLIMVLWMFAAFYLYRYWVNVG